MPIARGTASMSTEGEETIKTSNVTAPSRLIAVPLRITSLDCLRLDMPHYLAAHCSGRFFFAFDGNGVMAYFEDRIDVVEFLGTWSACLAVRPWEEATPGWIRA